MSHPRIEEVSDSDLASDPEEVDLDDFDDADIMRRIPDPESSAASAPVTQQQRQRQPPPSAVRPDATLPNFSPGTNILPTQADRSAFNGFQCLYPVYFDASRTRAQGRRVASALAVRNPIAREIAHACQRLRLQTLLEPEKVHPKDWANPGRVKVALKKNNAGSGGGGGGGAPVRNKHHLYILVAEHLRAHPTTEDSPGLRVRIGGVVQPDETKPYPRPAVPRGWHVNEFVPYLSAAMTGGGVSENLFKDMMKEMQSGGDPMAALMAAQEGGDGGSASGTEKKKKKDKKGKGRV